MSAQVAADAATKEMNDELASKLAEIEEQSMCACVVQMHL